MKNFKLRGVIPAVKKYIKSKPLHLVILEIYAFGVLLPMSILGILFMSHHLIFVGVWFII